jgi:hypothetical protein
LACIAVKDRMTLKKRLRVGVFSLVAAASIAGVSAAETPKALSDADARAPAHARGGHSRRRPQ